MTKSDALSKPRRFFFRLFTVLLSFLLLAGVEAGLRIAGYGGYPPFLRVAGALPSGDKVCLVEPAASKPYFFANPSRPGYAEQTNFLMPKPADTIRIFLFGESAAKGYPQPRNLAVSTFLQSMLEDVWPDRHIEVINMGTTAVASFPIIYAVRDATDYQPDLFIFYVGNNEFFGAYGTESINRVGGNSRWLTHVSRHLRGLAIFQIVAEWLYTKPPVDKSLMEEMMGSALVPVDSPSRARAARNLRINLDKMLDISHRAGIPAIVCTTASNESGLRPLGANQEAIAHFEKGRLMLEQGDSKGAREAFLDARDMDTLPWRPIRHTENAIRESAANQQALLCDIADIFRDMSPEGATGWDLVDDHVHLSVKGQAMAARAMITTMTNFVNELRVNPESLKNLPEWNIYAHRLGTNFLDDYRVNHTLRILFSVPFMKQSNPEAFKRFETACRRAEMRMPPALLSEARRWQTMAPHAGGLRPLTGMAARTFLASGKTEEALNFYRLAQRQVPDYTSWYLEYVYFELACLEIINGNLTTTELNKAQHGIEQGLFLLAHGESVTGLTERYVGRLHQLRSEWAEAIPMLLAARKKLSAEDLVACDKALVTSYIKIGDKQAALALTEDGIQNSGRFSAIYQQMKSLVETSLAGES
ncbi:MAG TPA: hypothetical protein PJ991_01830 [Kiritimatiellia bacterium]|nr:hypothetical protein [Kiritimatiellia bacterium]